jgi:hypothetical protein
VRAFGQEGAQPLGRLRNGIRPRDADDVEALGASARDQRRFDRLRCQKSRSA